MPKPVFDSVISGACLRRLSSHWRLWGTERGYGADCRRTRGGHCAGRAGEGLAAPALLGPATLLLLGGQVLPVICLLGARPDTWTGVAVAGLGVMAAYYPRWQAWRRFRQSGLGACLHTQIDDLATLRNYLETLRSLDE
jgi:hypothetical protein